MVDSRSASGRLDCDRARCVTCAMLSSAPVTPRRGDERERRDAVVPGRGHHADRAALAVADDRDALPVHVLAIAHELQRPRADRRRSPRASPTRDARRSVPRRACRSAAPGNRRRRAPLASSPKIGMPATVSSRSVGPDPPTRMTAGSRAAGRRVRGSEIVPASEKPLAGTRTCSSFGATPARRRVDTAPMSSRTTSSACAGMLTRSSRPFSSPQISTSTAARRAAAGMTRVRRASMTRATVWSFSVDDSPTAMTMEPCGAMYARDRGADGRRAQAGGQRLVRARRTGSAAAARAQSMVSVLCPGSHAVDLELVLRGRARDRRCADVAPGRGRVASSVSSSGFQSGVVARSRRRRVTMSSGGPIRPAADDASSHRPSAAPRPARCRSACPQEDQESRGRRRSPGAPRSATGGQRRRSSGRPQRSTARH